VVGLHAARRCPFSRLFSPHGPCPDAAAAHVNGTSTSSSDPAFESFLKHAVGANVVPVYERIFSDQITPVTAYRCLVSENDVEAPSFLLESVVNGDQQGRYSFVGAMPSMELLATRNKVTVLDHVNGERRRGPPKRWIVAGGAGG
jgi:anthranilate synthase component 1